MDEKKEGDVANSGTYMRELLAYYAVVLCHSTYILNVRVVFREVGDKMMDIMAALPPADGKPAT